MSARRAPTPFRDLDAEDLREVVEVACAYLAAATSDDARGELGGIEGVDISLGAEGNPREQVASDLLRLLIATPYPGGPRFFNQLYGGTEPTAVVAEMVSVIANTQMHTRKVAGPQAQIEQVVLEHMAERIGFTAGEGVFCPGGSISNLLAMIVARDRVLPQARNQGLDGARLTVYTSADGHYSIRKNAGVLGLGRDHVREIPTDHEGRMVVAELERVLAADLSDGARPLFINATAGTTVLGAFDPLRAIAEVAKRFDVWLHVDASFGGSLVLSPTRRQLLDGCEQADSVAWSPHKMMGIPVVCSALLLRSGGGLQASLDESAEYLFASDRDGVDAGRRSLQCGRRNDALKLWCAWRRHGDLGWAERIERQFALVAHAARYVRNHPELELVREPTMINVCLEMPGRSSEEICQLLEAERSMLIGHGPVDGRQVVRMVCSDPSISESDVEEALERIADAGRRVEPAAVQLEAQP